jgi:gluconolactonase
MATSDFYEVLDPRFGRLFNGNAQVDKLWTGCRWAEGPAYFAAGQYLVWSDIPNDRMMRYDETDGSVSVFRHPAGNTNGHTLDRQGRLLQAIPGEMAADDVLGLARQLQRTAT